MPWWKKDPEPDPKPSEPAPKYVTEEALQHFQREVTEGLSFLRENFTPQRRESDEPPPSTPPAIRDVSDDDYQTALDNLQNPDFDGDRRAQMRVIQVRESASRERLKRDILQEVETRYSAHSQALANVNEEITRRGLNELPYYKLFKREIDAALSKAPIENRNMQMAQIIHNQIIASNQSKVIDYELEQRKLKDVPVDSDIPGRSHRSQRDAKVTFSSQFGEEISDLDASVPGGIKVWDRASRTHRSPDDFAKGLGFENADDYAQFSQSLNEITTCDRCFSEIFQGKCNCEAMNAFIGRGRISLLK